MEEKISSSKLTKKQLKIMKHTISGPNRNWFATGFDTDDSIEFEKLVISGLATKESAPSFSIDEVLYRLTPAGLKIIKER